MMSLEKEFNKHMNLLRFNVNFSKYADCNLYDQSPDYIIEKYNHWIGFEPTSEHPYYTPDDCQTFIHKYYKRWGQRSETVRRYLLYLKVSETLNMLKMAKYFEKYIGPIDMISSERKTGLHAVIEKDFIPKVLELNKENIKIIMRDIKINLINE